MLFFHLYKIISFFTFCVIMYLLNITKAMKKMSINEIKGFILENYFKRIGFSKEKSYYSMKHLKEKDLLLPCKQINRKNT